MQAPRFSERIHLAGLRLGAAVVRAGHSSIMPLRYLLSLGSKPPSRLIIAPQDIHTADPTVAEQIYSGYFAFGSKALNVHGASPFTVETSYDDWRDALMGFGWLRDLRAAGTPLAKANAAALVEEWISLCGTSRHKQAWGVPVASRRLLSWLSHSPLILENADLRFYRTFMKSIGRHVAFLRRQMASGLSGEARLLAATALVSASLCSEGMGGSQKRATKILAGEISRQILLDGGHLNRNPQMIVDLLLDFLPLRQAFVARNIEVPAELVQAIDRMLPMLRLFRHTDGALALFNGMGVTRQDALSTVLAYDDARAKPLMHAIASGFQRAEAGDVVLICDMGKPPQPEFSRQAHAGTLSFEMSSGRSRIIVNCGSPEGSRGPLRDAARVTAAHSTLSIDDIPSSVFAGHTGPDRLLAGRIVSGPRHVNAERFETADGITVQASHDGYASRFGLVHERGIAINSDGSMIAGRDRLLAAKGKSPDVKTDGSQYTIRFHLHPTVRAGSVDGGQGVLLVTADGQQWDFRSSSTHVEIQESVLFAGPDGSRVTSQLVLSGSAMPDLEIDWTFERQ